MFKVTMFLAVAQAAIVLAIGPTTAPAANGGPAHKRELTTLLPESGAKTFGAWVASGNGNDVHVYTQQHFAVIGHNRNYAREGFSAMALALQPDGKASMQFADSNGQAVIVDLPLDVVEKHILTLLETLKLEAKARARN